MERVHSGPLYAEWVEEGIPKIDASDRDWIEKVGGAWPDAEQEEAWLVQLNNNIEIGSEFYGRGQLDEDGRRARNRVQRYRRRVLWTVFGVDEAETQDYFRDQLLLPSNIALEKVREVSRQAIADGIETTTLRDTLLARAWAADEETLDTFFDEFYDKKTKDPLLSIRPAAPYSDHTAGRGTHYDDQPDAIDDEIWREYTTVADTLAAHQPGGRRKAKRAGTEEIVEVPDYLYLGEAMEIGPVAKIDARDRAWLEVYGLRWPEPKHEAAWLKEVNEQLALSSASAHRVEGATVGARIEQKDAIVKARHFMLDLLPALAGAKEDILAHSRSRNSLVAGDHMLGVLRMFSNVEGIAKQIAQTGMILTRTTSTITRNMLGTEKLGFNVKRVLDSGGVATFSSFSPEAIAERLQPMYTALRVWGVPNYKEVVHAYIERQPVIINYRSDKTRLIARILSSLVTRTDIGDSVQAKLISLYAAPAVNLAHAYSETQGPVSFEAFMAKVRKNINADRSALLWELLQKDSGDPVTKILLRSWPVRDPEALRWAYDRHKRATGRRREHIDLEWQGRAALGDEATDAAYEAFRRATESPPLSAEELDELDRRIRLGSIASKHIEVLRRAAPLEPFEDAELETTAAKGVAARKALVVRHLGMVIAYADYRKYGAEIQAEIAATANLHLVKAAAAYDPQAGKSFADVADEAISMALSLPRLHPKGYSVNDDAAA